MNKNQPEAVPITTWKQFTRTVRSQGCNLLQRLDDFPEAVLVTGCQRSGTTILARIITQSEGMFNYWFGADDELDAALILSGQVAHTPAGRYCFQTTYLDECYREYEEHSGPFKMIWVIRNPYSVAYSLMYNWATDALGATFSKCAASQLTGFEKIAYRLFGLPAIPPSRRASYLYKAKTQQLFELFQAMGKEKIFIVDYDDLVMRKETVLPRIFRFINLAYNPDYSQQLHRKSVDKKTKLSNYEMATIAAIAEPIYLQAKELKEKNFPGERL